MSHDAAAHGAVSTAASPFSPEEIAALHEEDRAAGRNIVLLMLCIFLMGVMMYAVIDWVAAGGEPRI